MSTHHQAIPVTESSQPFTARHVAQELAASAGLDEATAHRAGLVATELATNLVKHATRGGELLLRVTAGAPHGEVELLALDRGPGMADVPLCLRDGHSTAGSPGTGLGAVQRLSDDFDLYSQPDRGTIVFARVRTRGAAAPPRTVMQVGVICVPKTGEPLCGDGWRVRHEVDGLVAMLSDGLGHGVLAADASRAAVAGFDANRGAGNAAVLQAIHDALRHTRGAAAAIAEIRSTPRLVKYAGVGNIAAAVVNNGMVRQAVSQNGTLGHEARHFKEYSYPWPEGALIVMHSDGLMSRWSLDPYHGLRRHNATVIAAVLYRDFSRERDDVTVLVAREAA